MSATKEDHPCSCFQIQSGSTWFPKTHHRHRTPSKNLLCCHKGSFCQGAKPISCIFTAKFFGPYASSIQQQARHRFIPPTILGGGEEALMEIKNCSRMCSCHVEITPFLHFWFLCRTGADRVMILAHKINQSALVHSECWPPWRDPENSIIRVSHETLFSAILEIIGRWHTSIIQTFKSFSYDYVLTWIQGVTPYWSSSD